MEPSFQFCFEVRDVMRWQGELCVGRRVLVWFADGKITLDVGSDSFGPYRWDGRRGRIRENLPLCEPGSTLYPLYQDIIEEKIRKILAAAQDAVYRVIRRKQKVRAGACSWLELSESTGGPVEGWISGLSSEKEKVIKKHTKKATRRLELVSQPTEERQKP